MGLFTPNHGNYEVVYKATTMWGTLNREKEQTIVVEADDRSDAKNQAEKQLKSFGYRQYSIVSVRLIKYTPGSRLSNERARKEKMRAESSSTVSTNNNGNNDSQSSMGCGAFLIIAVLFLAMVFGGLLFFKSCSFDSGVEGTYYLSDISGTSNIRADKSKNYLEMIKGKCTLHFNLIDPAGSSVIKYNYSGDEIDNINFEEEFINMESDGSITIRLDYDNGYYNVLSYVKEK